jgi:hypothetical protein
MPATPGRTLSSALDPRSRFAVGKHLALWTRKRVQGDPRRPGGLPHNAAGALHEGRPRLGVKSFDPLPAKILGGLRLQILTQGIERQNSLLEGKRGLVLRPVDVNYQGSQLVQFDPGLLQLAAQLQMFVAG